MKKLSLNTPSHVDHLGDPMVPFYAYLQQAKASATAVQAESPRSKSFPFLRFPLELQRSVLEFCDLPTLLSLMHTNSHLQLEASSLFWSYAPIWYHVYATWMLRDGDPPLSYPEDPNICPHFASSIQQIELDCLGINKSFEVFREPPYWSQPLGELENKIVERKLKFMWTKLEAKFPSVKRVALRESHVFPPEHFPVWYATFIRTAPPHISVLLTTFAKEHEFPQEPANRALYQLRSDSKFILLKTSWTRHCVLPPRRKIADPIGTFLQFDWRRTDRHHMYYSLQRRRKEAYEKYHFGGSRMKRFKCPAPDCEEWFEKAGDYTRHIEQNLLHFGWNRREDKMDALFTSPLPVKIEEKLQAMEAESVKAMHAADNAAYAPYKDWGKRGVSPRYEKERRLYEEQFLAQLESDPIFRSQAAPTDHWIWHSLIQSLSLTEWYI
jgi:hypothetical protein